MRRDRSSTRRISEKIRLFAGSVLTLIGAFYAAAAWSTGPLQWRWSDVDSVVAVADIHGDYDAFVTVLRQAKVVDDDLEWTGGAAHLVVVGDVLDRGPDSRRVLDLLMRLEPLAAAAGGRVHMTLGNHEVMNLTGDLRYVSREEFMAFEADDPEDEREQLFDRFVAEHPEIADPAVARNEFESRYPPGFLAHRAAFAPDGVYGAWLLERPLLIVINETAFVHGGLSAAAGRLGGDGINGELRAQIQEYAQLMYRLQTQGVLSPSTNFYDHPEALNSYAQRVAADEAAWPEGLEAAAERLTKLNAARVFDQESPLWYRGTVGCTPLLERQRLETALGAMPANRVVLGHTPTARARILSRMEGRVLRIDTGMLNAYYGGRGAALVLAGDTVEVLYEGDMGPTQPTRQPRRVGRRPANLTATALEEFLQNASIVDRVDGEREMLLTLQQGDIRVQVVFTPSQRSGRGFYPDVAAYRLDRVLGLDMVPVAVVREVDGKTGALRFAPRDTITETVRSTERRGASAWCPLSDQFQAMYVFDALVFNEGRTMDAMLYDVNNWQLILVSHERSFGTKRGRPQHLANVDLLLSNKWVEQLTALDSDGLKMTMSGVLDAKRIKALLRRRDALIKNAAP
ncbi:MAG: metallophosphoesterase [Chromatiales bacterium]|nr:MAG: metallophosphoesterase [Chromatiales bacterium]